MENNNGLSKRSLVLLFVVMMVIEIVILFYFFRGNPLNPDEIYFSEAGFSFRYPSGYKVEESQSQEYKNTQDVYLLKTDDKGETIGPPVVVITVSPPAQVSFNLWEGAGWSGFEKLIHSFQFDPDAPEGDNHLRGTDQRSEL